MKARKLLSTFLIVGALGACTVNAAWTDADIGGPTPAGSTADNGDGTFTMTAGGGDIWGNSDQFHYRYQSVSGKSWAAMIRVHSLDGTPSTWAKNELMIRESDTAGARFLAFMTTPANGQNQTSIQWRTADAGAADAFTPSTIQPTFPNTWMMIIRDNDIFTMYYGRDGVNWTQFAAIDTAGTAQTGADNSTTWGTPLGDPVLIGDAVTSHAQGTATTSMFSDLQVTTLTPPNAAGVWTQIADLTARAGCEASFHFVATNNAFPIQAGVTYAWYKNGALVPNVTGPYFTWIATAADNNAQIKAVGTVNGYPSLTATSATATLTVTTDTVLGPGVGPAGLKLEVLAGATRADVYAGNTPPGDGGNATATGVKVPGKLRWLSAFEDNGGYGDNTSRRVTGLFTPWLDGAYTFYVAADDDTDVYLSTDATAANKTMICQEPGWTAYNYWTNNADGAAANLDANAIAQKCSDTWTNGTGTSPNATGITLKAGTQYYIEMVLHNGTGGDNGGVTAKLFTEPGPANGSASTLCAASNNIAVISWQPTTFTFGMQPTNVLVAESQTGAFFARAANDGEFAPHYQWYRGGAAVAGATSTTFSIGPATPADNGAQVFVVASIPLMTSITSSVVSLTVESAVFEPGFVMNQKWSGQNRAAVHNGTFGLPTLLQVAIPAVEAAVNGESGSTYTRKISGFFIPPSNGSYNFVTCSDDQSDLYLSTDANPANAANRMIAQETGWSGVRAWGTQGGGGTVSQKRSDQWIPAGGTTAPFANGISLVAGTKYYFEVVQEEGGGGDNVEVTYFKNGDAFPADGTASIMTSAVIGMNAPKCTKVWFTQQPVSQGPITAGLNTATFTANGSSDSQVGVGGTSAINNVEGTNAFVFFQWMRNGSDLAGATTSTYTTPYLKVSDNGAQYVCKMRALGYGQAPNTRWWSNSDPATLTVVADPTVPVITAGYMLNNNEIPPAYQLSVTFSTMMDPTTLTSTANYNVPGATVTGVLVTPDNRRVLLTLSAAPTFPLNITVTGVKSWSGIAPTVTTAAVAQLPAGFNFVDIGADDVNTGFSDPVMPSKLWIDGANAYTLAVEGHDIWDNADGFNFLYEQKTGNFDVVLRQTAYTPTDRWSKCGLMVRELIDPKTVAGIDAGKSRDWNCVNDPPNVPCLADGNGANVVEANCRPSFGAASQGWPGGVVNPAPTYPTAWVRIKRVGQILTAYAGSDGVSWTRMAETDVSTNATPGVPLPETVYVGICNTAHHNDAWDTTAGGFGNLYWFYPSVDNYNSSYVQPTAKPTLAFTLQGSNLVISWTPTGGTLQTCPDIGSPVWTDVGTANPATIAVPAGVGKAFYRVKQ